MTQIVALRPLIDAVPPAPFAADLAALSCVKSRMLSPRAAVRILTPRKPPQPDWGRDAQSLADFHGVGDEHHCLNARVHDWLWPLERQATEGFAAFLDPPSRELKLERVAAFLRALPPPACGWPERIETASVFTEHRTGKRRRSNAGRVDLIVAAGGLSGFAAAVIEAKFGHDVSTNPLGDYVRAAMRMGFHQGSCVFLIVGLDKDRIVRRRLKANPSWGFLGWRRLLRALETQMRPEIDDDDYRRFRRTLFARIH
jgi:hypothetical protein